MCSTDQDQLVQKQNKKKFGEKKNVDAEWLELGIAISDDKKIFYYNKKNSFQASKLVDKVVDVLSTQHGAWSSHDTPHREFWKLDVWEDDARRRRRWVTSRYYVH